MGNELPKSVLISYMLAMRNRSEKSHLLNQLDNILFLGGLHDKLITNIDMKTQVKLLKNKANGHIVDDVAHMSMIESPIYLETVIRNFLRDINND